MTGSWKRFIFFWRDCLFIWKTKWHREIFILLFAPQKTFAGWSQEPGTPSGLPNGYLRHHMLPSLTHWHRADGKRSSQGLNPLSDRASQSCKWSFHRLCHNAGPLHSFSFLICKQVSSLLSNVNHCLLTFLLEYLNSVIGLYHTQHL